MNKRGGICLLVILAAFLRISAIDFGLPYLFHADEPIVVNHALSYASGDLHPHFFKIPPLVSYLLFALYGMLFVVSKLFGFISNSLEFENLFLKDPTLFYVVGRIFMGAVLGTLSVLMLYRLVLGAFGRTRALCTAFIFAVCFLHVRDSHYIYADIPLIASILLTFQVYWKYVDMPSGKLALWAGAAAGLCAAIKYNGAAVFIPFAWIVFTRTPKIFFGRLSLAAAVSCAVFFLLNPFAVIDWPFFLQELFRQGEALQGAGLTHHLRYSLVGSGGLFFLAVSALGLITSVFSRDLKKHSFALWTVLYYMILVRNGQHYDRYVLPMIPMICFFAADFCVGLSERFQNRKRPVLLALGLLILLPSLTRSVLWIQIMKNPDVRTVSKKWIEDNLPDGSALAADWSFYAPRLRMSDTQITRKLHPDKTEEPVMLTGSKSRRLQHLRSEGRRKPSYDLFELSFKGEESAEGFTFSWDKVPYDVGALKTRGIRYVLIGRYNQTFDEKRKVFLAQLNAEGKRIRIFSPFKDETVMYPLDEQPLTGGPFLLKDILTRRCNGQRLELYDLRSESSAKSL